ncbi:LPS-assembly protein LptD [Pelosinus sp. sgz500959]|uniref:LPS-assembly protein LptD n=1 Tax=Pelosinus sp. sgz500959 TaxID=3242472 RepID=UPI0036703C1A
MQIKKFMFSASLCMLITSIVMTGQAADKQENKSTDVNAVKLPVVVEADELSFSDLTGDLFAKGNVVLTKNVQVISTEEVRGNTKQTEIWIDGKAILKEADTTLVGTGTHYNYTSRIGNMHEVKGKVGKEYLSGTNVDFSPEKMVAFDGTVTRCPAVVPDYHISAEKVEIWPGEKMIVHNAKFWIGKMMIYSMATYETSLVPGQQKSAFPRIGYDSSTGLSISQYFEYPLADRLTAFIDADYYSKQGFMPTYGFASRQNDYTIKLYQGKEKNGDDEWVEREPELMLKMNSKRFGKVIGDFTATSGKWSEGAITGWRQSYKLYFSRDPIQLNDKTTLVVGSGFENINYGYDKSTNNIWSIDTTVTVKPNERFETWMTYAYNNQSGTSPYDYDRLDTSRELFAGLTYHIDARNSASVKMDYYLDASKIKDMDYTWRHNLHCIDADLTYRAKRGQWNLKLSTVEW